jgi:Leucine-rich repeat (LRR) protein/GTPase SAR1 family protein
MARKMDYPTLKELIEAARISEVEELDLSNMGLPLLPESLSQLTQLRSLNLGGNELSKLPESFGQLRKLQSLMIDNNQLTKLPESLCELTNLKVLYLNSNHLKNLPESLGQLTQLQTISLDCNKITVLPESFRQLSQLRELSLGLNNITELPKWLGELIQLRNFQFEGNNISVLPTSMRHLKYLQFLGLGDNSEHGNPIKEIPAWIAELEELTKIDACYCQLTDLPVQLCDIQNLDSIKLKGNPLNLELAAVYQEGFIAVKRYLHAKAEAQVIINEAKLILVGEGMVGKSCLLSALRGDEWIENRDTTHGIEIKSVKVTDDTINAEITLNAWDFGGQQIYRPTHQLFFSSPAVYLVVWMPREGSRQGFVNEWIKLIKHREPKAKIIVVATHGGPKERQPDISRQEIWDQFGRDTVVDFFHIDSKPSEYDNIRCQWKGERKGVKELKSAIAKLAFSLPEVGRTVPKRWQDVNIKLSQTGEPYMLLDRVLSICDEYKMIKEEAQDFIRISHRLGHLIHYGHDPRLREIVVLKPDWLATAISFVLDDEETRKKNGLVSLSRLSKLWDNNTRAPEFRYPAVVHPLFVALMERFDLSYRVVGPTLNGMFNDTILIAQLVPDIKPVERIAHEWPMHHQAGDEQQIQICKIVDLKGQSSNAEGLFYQLIVRLHKFSLGRENFNESVHWQRGLILDDDYNGRALLEHVENDVRITVRASYPGNMLAVLTREVKWLVENFWEGLKCQVLVPCVEPCGKNMPGTGLFEVQKLIAYRRRGMTMFPCTVSGCDQDQNIDSLLLNAPLFREQSIESLLAKGFDEMRSRLEELRQQNLTLDKNLQRVMSQVEEAYHGMMLSMIDEVKDCPRLFSMEPIEQSKFNPKGWVKKKFRVTLWCEHTRLPLPLLNKNDKEGVYEFEVTREWFVTAAPFLKVLSGTLSLLLPVAASTTKLVLEETTYKRLENQLDFGKNCAESMLEVTGKASDWFYEKGGFEAKHPTFLHQKNGVLREFQSWLKKKDPSFGDLRRVMNKQKDFLWVHRDYEKEY